MQPALLLLQWRGACWQTAGSWTEGHRRLSLLSSTHTSTLGGRRVRACRLAESHPRPLQLPPVGSFRVMALSRPHPGMAQGPPLKSGAATGSGGDPCWPWPPNPSLTTRKVDPAPGLHPCSFLARPGPPWCCWLGDPQPRLFLPAQPGCVLQGVQLLSLCRKPEDSQVPGVNTGGSRLNKWGN